MFKDFRGIKVFRERPKAKGRQQAATILIDAMRLSAVLKPLNLLNLPNPLTAFSALSHSGARLNLVPLIRWFLTTSCLKNNLLMRIRGFLAESNQVEPD